MRMSIYAQGGMMAAIKQALNVLLEDEAAVIAASGAERREALNILLGVSE